MAKTSIAGYDAEHVTIRGKDLVADLMGKVSFTELMLLQLTGKTPTPAQVTILDAVLVTIMEHGLVPSAIVTRLTLYGAPESVQGAIVAGLLGVGDRFAGTASECAQLLEKIVAAGAGERANVAVDLVKDYRARKRPIPGFGHPIHRDIDPRSQRLVDIVKAAHAAQAAGAASASSGTATDSSAPASAGSYISALEHLEQAVLTVIGKRIVTNVSAAIAVALCEAGVPSKVSRGVVLTARCAGLVGHLHEESESPAGEAMWNAITDTVKYEP
ncbi:MAG: citryl-CoA lyase [Gammaproteobacteria bacterium]